MPKWSLNVRTYELQEDGSWKLVLMHSFFGDTKKEAEGYYQSHLKTDDFLRGCTKRGKWKDVVCYSDESWQKL